MFSSLASFLFGSNTSASANSEANQNLNNQQGQENNQANQNDNKEIGIEDVENTIEVTSSTPSVTGANSLTSGSIYQAKRGSKKRNRNLNKTKRQGPTNGSAGAGQKKPTSSITKLLTPNDSLDEDFDDDDWFIVEKEGGEEDDSLPRTDSEEEVSVVEIKPRLQAPASAGGQQQNRRRHFHINSHSLYSGPRPQQQRNFLQRARNSGARLSGPFAASSLNQSSAAITTAPNGLADGGMTQSLYVASNPCPQQQSQQQHNDSFNGANTSMEESWYVTPPPCFTSVGPVNLETSPYENLLIEHPSMSVYHSIRSAQEATDSFVNLDLGANESQQRRPTNAVMTVATTARNQQSVQQRSSGGARIDRQSAAQLKQELLARNTQKNREKKERQKLCATAMKRSNAAREYQSKGSRPRRSELQHYRVNSGANNNRNTSRKAFF